MAESIPETSMASESAVPVVNAAMSYSHVVPAMGYSRGSVPAGKDVCSATVGNCMSAAVR